MAGGQMTDWPIVWASAATVLIFLILLIVVWSKKRDEVLEGAKDKRAWRDLRIWATLLIGVQLIIYYLFS